MHGGRMNFSGISSKSILGKALRFPLKLIPSSARVPIIQGPLRGKLWIVGSSNHGCWLGSYENGKRKKFLRQPSLDIRYMTLEQMSDSIRCWQVFWLALQEMCSASNPFREISDSCESTWN
jgi:hypothetical protein